MASVGPGGCECGEREMPHRHRTAAVSVPALHHRPPEERQVPGCDPPQVPHQRELGAGNRNDRADPVGADVEAWKGKPGAGPEEAEGALLKDQQQFGDLRGGSRRTQEP